MSNKAAIYQTGTINSLMEAVYDGDTSIEYLTKKGSFGIGAFDAIDGEMIVYEGICYRANAAGQLNKVDAVNKTPFAMVSNFTSEIEFKLKPCNFSELEQQISAQMISANVMYAIEVIGEFKYLDLRSEHCTCKPYRRLTEILPALQTTFQFNELSGVLIGLWFPKYMAQLNVPGFHFHFMDDSRSYGGHVFGLELLSGECRMQVIHGFQMELLATPEFYQADLSKTKDSEVAVVEQIRK